MTLTTDRPDPSPSPARTRVAARAFGLALDADFPIPGAECEQPDDGLPRVTLRRVPAREIDRRWPAGSTRLSEERLSGRADRTLDQHPSAGYRLYARYFGLALVSAGGERVDCAPPPGPDWHWQRFLTGRVLPLVALLRGYEPLHASGVAVGGGAVAILGGRGAGKTSLAAHLASSGATLLSDDVLAVAPRGEVAYAHPGAGVVSLRESEARLAELAIQRAQGRMLGWSGKSHVGLPRAEHALPVRSIYRLRESVGEPRISQMEGPDPRLLLASSVVHEVRTRERLRRQLDCCAVLARQAPMFWLDRGSQGAARTAQLLDRHVGGG